MYFARGQGVPVQSFSPSASAHRVFKSSPTHNVPTAPGSTFEYSSFIFSTVSSSRRKSIVTPCALYEKRRAVWQWQNPQIFTSRRFLHAYGHACGKTQLVKTVFGERSAHRLIRFVLQIQEIYPRGFRRLVQFDKSFFKLCGKAVCIIFDDGICA